MNRHVTIHFGKAHIYPPQRALLTFLKRAGDWVRKRSGLPPVWVYALENPEAEMGKGGLHAHILFHVPPRLAAQFDERAPGWLLGRGREIVPGAVHSGELYFVNAGFGSRKYLEHGLLYITGYLMKGSSEENPAGLNPKPQGIILGKRSGYSEALGVQHRYPRPIRLPRYPGVWIAGQHARRRRALAAKVPELFCLPASGD